MLLSIRDGQVCAAVRAGAQALCDGVAAEAAPGAGAEQGVSSMARAFVQPGAQQVLDGAVEWDGALFASLPRVAQHSIRRGCPIVCT